VNIVNLRTYKILSPFVIFTT